MAAGKSVAVEEALALHAASRELGRPAAERYAALEAGCETFFQKPFTPESLALELERLSWRYRLRPSADRRGRGRGAIQMSA